MTERYFCTKGSNYTLWICSQLSALGNEILTIINHNEEFREEPATIVRRDNEFLNLIKNYDEIEVHNFSQIQNKILINFQTTREDLINNYKGLWKDYNDARLNAFEDELRIVSDRNNSLYLSDFRSEKYQEYEVIEKRKAIHDKYEEIGQDSPSNDFIYNLVSTQNSIDFLLLQDDLLIKYP